MREVDPFKSQLGAGGKSLPKFGTRTKDGKLLSAPQIKILTGEGYNPASFIYKQIGAIIKEIHSRPGKKQMPWLKKYGLYVPGMTRKQATEALTNHWGK
jgi:hypothetical protein